MLSQEERNKKITWSEHFITQLYDRKSYFPHCCNTKEKFKECVDALKNQSKSVIVKDLRENVNSTHICIFLNQAGSIIGLPIAVNENNIHLFTIKNIKEDWNNPNWFIEQYNLIGRNRGLPTLPYIVK